MYTQDGKTLVCVAGSLTSVNIRKTVTQIGGGAFAGCTGLTSIRLPARLTTIGNSAFQNCTSLTSIGLPASLTTIGGYAFSDCTGLTSAFFADKESWKVYSDKAHTENETEISSSDLENNETAVKYLREWNSHGGYCNRWWKKN